MGSKQSSSSGLSSAGQPIAEISGESEKERLCIKLIDNILDSFSIEQIIFELGFGRSGLAKKASDLLGNETYNIFKIDELTPCEFTKLENMSIDNFIKYEILQKKLNKYFMTRSINELRTFDNKLFYRNVYSEVTRKLLGFITTNQTNTYPTKENCDKFYELLTPLSGSLKIDYDGRVQLTKTRFFRELVFQSKLFDVDPCIEYVIKLINDFNNTKFQRIEGRHVLVSDNKDKPSAPQLSAPDVPDETNSDEPIEGNPPGGANLE